MKIVAIIPIKSKSERVRGKNFRKIKGKPLYRYLLDKLKKCDFDEIYVDSDSKEIAKYCRENKFKYIERLSKLAKNNANGNDLLNYHQKLIKADCYFQLFVTSPLIKVSSINQCIRIMRKNKNYDSIFTIKKIFSWFWYKKNPVNYNPKILPRSQDATPVIQETTALYGIRAESLKARKCRIGKKPYMFELEDSEVIDLDNEVDFQYLKYYVKKLSHSSK
tara:strand:+ start:207 stop:866 length:660 start_codon:yes stop_codon:yes gene_type:complete